MIGLTGNDEIRCRLPVFLDNNTQYDLSSSGILAEPTPTLPIDKIRLFVDVTFIRLLLLNRTSSIPFRQLLYDSLNLLSVNGIRVQYTALEAIYYIEII